MESKELKKYIKEKKNDFTGTFKRLGKSYISFRNKDTGRFTGYVRRNMESENLTKKYLGWNVKIRVKLPEQRKKVTFTYRIYNNKQKDEILFRMNKRLRNERQINLLKRRDIKVRKYSYDSIPMVGKKRKINLLFDKYKFERAKIDYYLGESP